MLAFPVVDLAGVGVDELNLARLFEGDIEICRVVQVLVHHHYEGLAVRPLELAHQQIGTLDLTEPPTCLATGTTARHLSIL